MTSSFTSFSLTPTKAEPLLEEFHAEEEKELWIQIVAGRRLFAGLKLTSNCQCECFLIGNGQVHKKFKTKIVKSSRNPIWNCKIYLGRWQISQLDGIQFVVRHVQSFSQKELGEVLVPIDGLFDANQQIQHGQWYPLQPTQMMLKKDSTLQQRDLGEISVSLVDQRPLSFSSSFVQSKQNSPESEPSSNNAPIMRQESNGLHDPQMELAALKKCHKSRPKKGETWFAVSSQWIQEWLIYVADVRSSDIYAPGPIPNMILMEDELSMKGQLQLRQDLKIKVDYRLIDEDSWKLYQQWYGGGPIVSVKIPEDCPNVLRWMSVLQLHKDASVSI